MLEPAGSNKGRFRLRDRDISHWDKSHASSLPRPGNGDPQPSVNSASRVNRESVTRGLPVTISRRRHDEGMALTPSGRYLYLADGTTPLFDPAGSSITAYSINTKYRLY